MRRLVLLLISLSSLALAGPSPTRAGRIDSEADRIMEMSLVDGTVLSSALVIYPFRGRWVLPLGQFAEALGVGITVWSKNHLAEGFVIDEGRKFRLTLDPCEVTYDNKTEPFRCEDVVELDDEFYVLDSTLAKWLPVDFDINSLMSQIIVKPRELLPAEARHRREQKAQLEKNMVDVDPGFPREPIPYGAYGLFALDQQLQLSNDHSTGLGRTFTGTSTLSGELLGMETSLLANYTEAELAGHRFTMQRRSPDGELWGPAKLSQIAVGDLDVPTVPLVTQVQPLQGILVSSYQLNDPLNWENTDLQGVLPANWEVLLFRNEVYFDRRVGDASGWYRFNNVPLQYGRNVMKLVFFGPHGERREKYQNFTIDREHQKDGRRDYRLAMGFKPTNGHPALSANWSESLTRGMTGLAGLYAEDTTGRQYGTLGLVGLTDFALGTARLAYSMNGGYATELGVQSGFASLAFGGKYTALHNFSSQLFNQSTGAAMQTSQLEANAYYLVPFAGGFAWTSDLLRRDFDNGNTDLVWRNRLTSIFGNLQVQTQLDYSPESAIKFTGRTELFHFPYALRFRGIAEYTSQQFKAVEAETQLVRPDRYQLTANVRVPFDGNPVRILLQLSKLFREISVGGFANAAIGGPYTFGLNVAFSVMREPRTGDLQMIRTPQAFNGAVSVMAFEDLNHNGVHDPEEPAVPGLELQICSRETAKTGANGIVQVAGLRAQFPCDIRAMDRADGDLFLRPVNEGVRITPRAGLAARIDFPMQRIGQIDGYVRTGKGKAARGKRNVEMDLRGADGTSIATTRSDSDGFYAFENVRAGDTYVVRVKDEWALRSGFTSNPEEKRVTVPPEGAFIGGQDFTVESERDPASSGKVSPKSSKNSKSRTVPGKTSPAADIKAKLTLPSGAKPLKKQKF